MPRIVHVISSPTGVGGAERVVAQLVSGGERRGWDQVVLNPFASSAPEQALYRSAECRFLPASSVRDVPMVWRWLRRELRALAPDIVHAHLFHAIAAVAALPAGDAARVATHHHGALFRWQGRRLEEAIDRWAGSRFDAVVAVSRAVQEHLVKEYRYPRDRVRCIPNGWDGNPLPRAPGPTLTALCIANFRPEKGHRVLLEAFQDVVRHEPTASLVLLGSGPLESDIRAAADDFGLREAVTFAGTVEDVWPILALAHVLVLPSLQEPLGIVVMEAMAAGVPVVASDVGGIPELVTDGVTGELVPPGDATALATSLRRVLTDRDLGSAYGEAGRSAASGLTAEAMVDRHAELYAELLT